MPGTVRITVLEVVDLPGPSGKKYAVQVAVGARAFSTDEQSSTSSGGSGTSSIKAFNSDFAFAVLNLTDPVVFTLLDARGVAVGKASLSVPSVVEKGIRDDMLPWSNGGQVHVKSSFMLSDEERAKIAAMRARSMSKQRKDGSSSSGTVTPLASGTVTPRTVSAVLASPAAAAAESEASTATEMAATSTTEATTATTASTTTTTTTVTTSTIATTETAAIDPVTSYTATSAAAAAASLKEAVAVAAAPVDMSNVMTVFDGSDDESGLYRIVS
ncbi:hypothetical protein CLOP_g17021 [Closterium sp. NIES-67]|nr:hypothetical protein CLOP_g17021 [Closterium sp. NIES-67]